MHIWSGRCHPWVTGAGPKSLFIFASYDSELFGSQAILQGSSCSRLDLNIVYVLGSKPYPVCSGTARSSWLASVLHCSVVIMLLMIPRWLQDTHEAFIGPFSWRAVACVTFGLKHRGACPSDWFSCGSSWLLPRSPCLDPAQSPTRFAVWGRPGNPWTMGLSSDISLPCRLVCLN
jgi:hypothetical protein